MTPPAHDDRDDRDGHDHDGLDHYDGRDDYDGHDDLLDVLGRALRSADPVPERVLAGARAAWTWRTIDAELAELVFDSATELAGVRGEDTARQLTFRAGNVEIDVMVVDGRRVLGQLVPPRALSVRLLAGDRQVEQMADDLGRFQFDDIGTGPVRLTVMDDPAVSTDWVVL